jgi:hypothetical protein
MRAEQQRRQQRWYAEWHEWRTARNSSDEHKGDQESSAAGSISTRGSRKGRNATSAEITAEQEAHAGNGDFSRSARSTATSVASEIATKLGAHADSGTRTLSDSRMAERRLISSAQPTVTRRGK